MPILRAHLNGLNLLLQRDDSRGSWMASCVPLLNGPSRLLQPRDGRRGFQLRPIVGRRGFRRREDSRDFLLRDLVPPRGVRRLRRFIRMYSSLLLWR